jgi:predicted GIY-YIG superfamily endonuclease
MNTNYIIYLLFNPLNNNTYIGITNNPWRRLRQHNGEISGGAKYTKAFKGDGEWLFYGWIKSTANILEKRRALSLEKKIQIRSRKLKGDPIERRLTAINNILLENQDLVFKTDDLKYDEKLINLLV